ncbi:laminin subunit alpha [Bacillus rossius redtenbacheri]|uniref:laminin subunit alpha n=1 Tax=Bacillus rossius redtenbacheri TaxID=93214 RepID=UPI002FDD8BDD
MWLLGAALCLLGAAGPAAAARSSVILTPPYFNLAEGRRATASSTCGEGVEGPELYCKLVGANADGSDVNINLIQGQVCDYCDPGSPDKRHPAEYAVDGAETWWQSPPLSRGSKYNEVNLTIDLGQEFHVAYVFIKMANAPRPGVWVLERSVDNGQTFQPWQFFADSLGDCEKFFGSNSLQPITRDDSVVCETQYSKIVPLEGGEIVVSLLNNRPSANDFFNSTVLQEWTRATNIRLRLLRHKTFLGHLMSVMRQDPTITRRYFYSIKDISIGGRCVCNGHADTCDITDPEDRFKLLCRCQHNTCGANCDRCCPGFQQKAWRISNSNKRFICEPCNCFGHTEECEYDPEVDARRQSLDIHGNYEGGGVCRNCRDNTEGTNCDRCQAGFFRPYGKLLNETDVCQPCDCNNRFVTGNCAEGSGRCECRPEFTPPGCDSCSFGHFGYPECRPCECHVNGTRGSYCEAEGGRCPCKENYAGDFCNRCGEGFYDFPKCLACACNPQGSLQDACDVLTGQCACRNNFANRSCDVCQDGYYGYPGCSYCSCDVRGTEAGVCDKRSGRCLCRPGYGGERCDRCTAGHYGYPDCRPCGCSEAGSTSGTCDASGRCPCHPSFAGRTCDRCSPGFHLYPECRACNCDTRGSIGVSCDDDGKCQCQPHFDGSACDQCQEGFYNFPICEECNCDPAGVVAMFAGCGSLPPGELCQCKERVVGRICDQCRPLFWNLQPQNPQGCEECDCHLPGVVGGLGVCDTRSGQCLCKSSVRSRRCDTCADGTFDLREGNLFGCSHCGCDVGGSVDGVCNKDSGQCVCRPRVSGRACREPLQAHYFPTLYQFQYEAENGRTRAGTPVRYGFDEAVFPGYSWKGYAVFSQLQNEVIQDISVPKHSIYRVVLRYVNLNPDAVLGYVRVTPENANDGSEQGFQVLFRPSRAPALVTVSGPAGGVPSPFVMTSAVWTVSVASEGNLFLDYFVFLPDAYYEAPILVEKVEAPCEAGSRGLCRHFRYPNVTQFDVVQGEGAYLAEGDSRQPVREYLPPVQGRELDGAGRDRDIPLLSADQPEISFDLRITKPGPHVLLLSYVTPTTTSRPVGGGGAAAVQVDVGSRLGRDAGQARLGACPYTAPCRQAVLDRRGQVAVYRFDSNFVSVALKGERDAEVAVESVVAIPLAEWSLDYQRPQPACVRMDGSCIQAGFATPPDSKKVEFEHGNELRVSRIQPRLFDNSTRLVYLNLSEPMIDITGKVDSPGSYVFVVHFLQPDNPEFDLDVLVHNGQMYEAKLPVKHCPSGSGCRSIVRQLDGNANFGLTENFVFTLKAPRGKNVWLDYLLVIPSDKYAAGFLEEAPVDHTRAFITQCGKNHFHINETDQGFCRDAVFSLTAEYNNGALPCHCDFDGALSFDCEQFGGQCRCRPNVIGRRCDACRTGFYGFPDCRPCDCPSTAFCETSTGRCICPPRVVGDRCDQCMNNTYGFDPIIGCEECGCDVFGVARGKLQCDLFNGSCQCKPNIVGRSCSMCKAGFWQFPFCEKCECDRRGTTDKICDQNTAVCHCKGNVDGPACDVCKDGTFNLQGRNTDGCTKCFCFGKTTRCASSSLYKAQVREVTGWTLLAAKVDASALLEEPLASAPDALASGIGVDLTADDALGKVVYLSAPAAYLGNRLTSYGGQLNYSVYYTTGLYGGAVGGADVILKGAGLHLLHFSVEQPAASQLYLASLDLVEGSFVLPSGHPATREQLMQALQRLEGLYVRVTYWEDSITTRLAGVSLDVAAEDYDPSAERADAVETCLCPPNYQGLSCEECAPGYYRSQTGPHGGFCVPCQCNGHADTCDQATGVCLDCQHNTTGDHCDECAIGYHGNATNGSPLDCLICACPLPIPSNNFATGCDVTPDGERISCHCRPNYYGARCQACVAGYYGRPEIPGEHCRPCECSGNINPDDPGSCDSVTGECLRCLNNTSGAACNLCAPGFFGDAVELKDCRSCHCDECGTQRCDSATGKCQCHRRVIGEKCDRCEVEHFGFASCQGCQPCDCQLGSESAECDEATGQCRCKPGVSGRTCDRCAAGFWNLGPYGCTTCGCNTEYSIGFGCNPATGQCECLPGVVGEKCDHCPHRWVLLPDQGCFECDSCSGDLLDVTDRLARTLGPVMVDFESVAQGYFTNQRLVYINRTADELAPLVNRLEPSEVDLRPVTQELESLEQDARSLHRQAEFAAENGQLYAPKGQLASDSALDVEEQAQKAAQFSSDVVDEIGSFASGLEVGDGTHIDAALREAQEILEQIQRRDFSRRAEAADGELLRANETLAKMQEFSAPVRDQSAAFAALRDKIRQFDDKLEDLQAHGRDSVEKVAFAQGFNDDNRNSKVVGKVNTAKALTQEANSTLRRAEVLIKNASLYLDEAGQTLEDLYSAARGCRLISAQLNDSYNDKERELSTLTTPVMEAELHAQNLTVRATELDNILLVSRNTSHEALKAANAYKDIVGAIEEALKAAGDAGAAAQEAVDRSQGLDGRSGESQARSTELLEEARSVLDEARRDLGPRLAGAEAAVAGVRNLTARGREGDQAINRFLGRVSDQSVEPVTQQAVADAEEARSIARDSADAALGAAQRLPEDLKRARQLPKDKDMTAKAIQQANSQIEKVNTVVPDIDSLMQQVGEKQSNLERLGRDVKSQIDQLKEKVALARQLANRIEVGLTFYRNTSLQLKNPDNLPQLGTSSKVSLYFRTGETNGLLLYLGNEISTTWKVKRARTDDFLALEIENGFPVLTVDLGSGPQRIISSKFVADNVWYQAIIERTGKNVRLVIREEVSGGKERLHVKEQVLPGTLSILNLDREHSSLFLGGYPPDANVQGAVKYSSFQGEMEGLQVGDAPVSLWNFVDGANNQNGAKERDKLVNLQPSTGLRFDGTGYAIMPSRSYSLRLRSSVQLNFSTTAASGLLFLAGKGRSSYLSVELDQGRVVYRFNLGKGELALTTAGTYNDGRWHAVDAARQGAKGVLTVDSGDRQDGAAPGGDKAALHVSPSLYFGGYPGRHNYRTVSNVDFEGCVDSVAISGALVDLSQNMQAVGAAPGCPAQVASLVAFEDRAPGYVLWPNASANNFFQVNFKFRTSAGSGLIFYATDADQSLAVSLSLVDGGLSFRSVGEELASSPATLYNDDEWHVVTATHDTGALRLDIDDFDTFQTDSAPPMLQFLYGRLYFGGLPNAAEARGPGAAFAPFVGCLGDVTVNGAFVNFANVTERVGAVLGRCPSEAQPAPAGPTAPTIPDEDEEEGVEEEEKETTVPVTAPVPATTPSTTPRITARLETTPETTTPALPEPAPTPAGRCVLPIPPATDPHVDGVRFGTVFASRLEYADVAAVKYKNKYRISLDFKTHSGEGVLLYVVGHKNIDFVALYLSDGHVHYGYNLGSGPALLTSPGRYDDGAWHTVELARQQLHGTLSLDGAVVAKGDSKAPAKTLNLVSPFYLGSAPPSGNLSLVAKIHMKGINGTFEGCMKDVRLGGEPIGEPTSSHGVVPCSDRVEPGAYFSEQGGYVKAYNKFTVGLDTVISMDIKPRNTSGLLLSVHGRHDYLLLQMVNGVIKFSVDNGKGAISASFDTQDEFHLCDGRWHNIEAIKTKNVVTLSVDKVQVGPFIGIPTSSSAETRNPLFVGGHPRRLARRTVRGLETRQQFTGCIANVFINGRREPLPSQVAVGNVTSSVCPTI